MAAPFHVALRCGGRLSGVVHAARNVSPGQTSFPVLLLHGGGQTHHAFVETAASLSASGLTAISLDLRGHGASSRAGEYSLSLFADDVQQAVQAIGGRPALVGASLGGLASLLARGEGGADIRALVLVDIAPEMSVVGAKRIVDFMESTARDGFADVEEARRAVEAYQPHRKVRRSESLLRNLRERDGRWFWHWDPAFLKFARFNEVPEQAARERERLTAAARAVKVKTLLVRGAMSDLVTPEAASALVGLVGEDLARVVDVKEAAHMVAGDSNQVFNDQINSFLRAL